MTDALYDAVARIARHEAGARTWAAIGRITEVHSKVLAGNDHAVSVRLRDTGIVVPRLPVAVGALGFAATPAVDDVVVVLFADGDPHAGVVIGRLYHRDLVPPEHGDGQIVLQLPPGATSPAIDLLVDPATPELTITVGDATVEVTGKTAAITIGDCTLTVDGNSSGQVEIAAGDASLTLKTNGDIALSASGKLDITANEITLEGSAKVTVSGGTVEIN